MKELETESFVDVGTLVGKGIERETQKEKIHRKKERNTHRWMMMRKRAFCGFLPLLLAHEKSE